MTPSDYGTIANQGVAALMFILFISGLLREWWVLGREYRTLREDRDFWRDAAQRGLDLTETAIQPRAQRQSHERR